MTAQVNKSQLNNLFKRKDEATLIIKQDHFVEASSAALNLLGISSLKFLKALHPAMVSPEFQPDGESSKIKAEKMISYAYEHGSNHFVWQHITLQHKPFDVEVTLRKRKEGDLLDVHWRLLS